MLHSGTKKIETVRLILRPFIISDSDDAYANWASNPNIQAEYGEPTYSSIDEVIALLTKWISNYSDEDFYRWAIIEKGGNQNIGQIAFCKVYSDCSTTEMEYCIGENF